MQFFSLDSLAGISLTLMLQVSSEIFMFYSIGTDRVPNKKHVSTILQKVNSSVICGSDLLSSNEILKEAVAIKYSVNKFKTLD
jgi:hypothetical protein